MTEQSPEQEDAASTNPPSQSEAKSQEAKRDEPKRAPPLKRPGVRRVLLIGLVVAAVFGAIWLFHYWTTGRFFESTDDAYIQSDAVTISPKVGGYVEEVLVKDNQDVQNGQPLVRIDPREYRAQAAQAQAQIDVAHANADAGRAQIMEQESAIAQARAQLASAQSNADFAAGEAARYAPLAASGAETQEQLAAKRNQARQSAMEVASQRAALESAEKRIASLEAQVRQAESQGESAAAQLSSANVDLQSTTLPASMDGRIGDLTVRVGQYVQPGTKLMTVVPIGNLYITANFKETQMGRMRPGQPANIKVDALSGVELHGRVESISPGTGAQFSLIPPENATGNFTKIVQRVPVRISIEAGAEARKVLVPGLSVTVDVNTIDAKGEEKQMRHDEKVQQGEGR